MKNFVILLLGMFLISGLLVLRNIAIANEVPMYPHWRKMQVIVYLPADKEYEQYVPMMKKALNEWQSKLNRKVAFWYTQSPRDMQLAEITVSFKTEEGENAQNSVSASLSSGNVEIRKATINVTAKVDPEFENDPEAKKKNDEELYAMMLHAGGKVLGLQNSTDENSIMFPERKDNQTITGADVEKLLLIYRQHNVPLSMQNRVMTFNERSVKVREVTPATSNKR